MFLDLLGSLISNQWADERQEDAQQFNSAEALANRQWQERMSNTAVQRNKADLIAAGFNPLLAIHPGGGASTPGGATANSGIGGGGHNTNYAASMASAAQVDAIEAAADKDRAEAEEIRERTKNYDPQRRLTEAQIPKTTAEADHLRQQIGESAARIEKIWKDVEVGTASAANLNQQTQNLREGVEQIRANVQHLRALAAQSSAATEETKQRIRENLPKLEATLHQLEATHRRMSQPAEANQAAAADSIIGQFGAYLDQLAPLSNVLGGYALGRVLGGSRAAPKETPRNDWAGHGSRHRNR